MTAEASPDLVADCVALWRELLGRDDVDADSNFFTEGGRSLLGARLVSRARTLTGVRVGLRVLIEAPTPRRFAAELAAAAVD
ncbi:phosphopantetheine-binding protein [Kutzneria kofuensis]|uniref:Carrier domain-containing protein n=1 Tax=Kutzneria kofuensis TaxID=103725 RepID=A0A7W9NLD7_9PSEU|nr:phosphopantetheine-binding protein [Kutzneria kofuensis]MBB5896361.1 hypothetical protein [Kutzneria kofuensis]